MQVKTGPLVQETTVSFSDWAQLTVRFYNDQQLEVDWTVGPLPDKLGRESREAIVRYWFESNSTLDASSESFSDGEFYMDSNGRRLIRRETGKRLYWNVNVTTPQELDEWRITGNYYPVNSRALVKGLFDRNLAFAVYTDRAQGMAMLRRGQLEFMVNRRSMHDDGFGVGEALKEDGIDGHGLVVRGTHVLRFDGEVALETTDRVVAAHVANPPILLFERRDPGLVVQFQQQIQTQTRTRMARMHRMRNLRRQRRQLEEQQGAEPLLNPFNPMPHYVNLMTLSKWPLESEQIERLEAKQVLLRFELFDTPSTPACVALDISNLLSKFTITAATETTIVANRAKAESEQERLKWPGEEFFAECPKLNQQTNGVFVNLKVGEIHTFLCDYTNK
ncbi:hypothetical protein Ciccas_003951 [Cichlidogyrus casuarinus]|uniref:Glycosyl hydrolase family 38 C-terminal domain-containing protein n=1 Tax=Cichlidogyrus casuarinus TaxID=1844966 RepID=A0ABD2QCW6_9PLAT